MALPSAMVLPLLIVVAAGIYYIYTEVIQFMSPSVVRNKVVVITDAISGVGSELARLFHKGGARLILCGTSWDKMESLYDSLTSEADPSVGSGLPALVANNGRISWPFDSAVLWMFPPKLVLLDFADMASMPEVVLEVVECYGCVDVLVCNSSMKLKAPVQSVSLELDRNIMDVNYFGPSALTKGILPTMISRRTGHILLVNSIQGRLAVPFRSSYAASKHAVQAFFDCLRAEVEEYGIVVSTISHTFINATDPPADASPAPGIPSRLAAFISSRLIHGVSPSALANEIVRTVNRKRKEVLLAHPIPWVALHLRSLFPSLLFSVLAAGVKDSALSEQM